jgi:hypothetical protein
MYIWHHFLREHVIKGDIVISRVGTNDQLADIFTKPLDEMILWTPKWTKHHWFLEYVLVCCTSDLKLVMLKKYAFMSKKSYLCKILFMLDDSNGFKSYIFFYFHNLSIYHTHTHYIYIYIYIYMYIYSIGPTPKSVGYRVFGRFLKFLEPSRQFSPDISGLWPEHIQLAGHVRLLARTCLGLGVPSYIKGTSNPLEP